MKVGCVHSFEGQCQKIILKDNVENNHGTGLEFTNLCKVYILTVQQNSTNVPMNVAGSIEAYASSRGLAIV